MDVRCPTSDPETVSTTSINNGQLARSTEKHEANAAFNDSASNSFWKTADVKEEGRQAVKRPRTSVTSFGVTSVVRVADLRFFPTLHGFRHTAPVGVKTIQTGRWWGQLVGQK